MRSAGEGHAWGCPPRPRPLSDGGRGSDGVKGSQREMSQAAAAWKGPGPALTTRARNPGRGLTAAAAAPMSGAGERLQSVAGSRGKRPPTGGRAGKGGGVGRDTRPVCCQRTSSGSPSPKRGLPCAAEAGAALARWPLAALPRPS